MRRKPSESQKEPVMIRYYNSRAPNQVIKTGDYRYLCKESKQLAKEGYVQTESKVHPDKKETWVFKKKLIVNGV
jgi:hypothetical protein